MHILCNSIKNSNKSVVKNLPNNLNSISKSYILRWNSSIPLVSEVSKAVLWQKYSKFNLLLITQ